MLTDAGRYRKGGKKMVSTFETRTIARAGYYYGMRYVPLHGIGIILGEICHIRTPPTSVSIITTDTKRSRRALVKRAYIFRFHTNRFTNSRKSVQRKSVQMEFTNYTIIRTKFVRFNTKHSEQKKIQNSITFLIQQTIYICRAKNNLYS